MAVTPCMNLNASGRGLGSQGAKDQERMVVIPRQIVSLLSLLPEERRLLLHWCSFHFLSSGS